METAFAGNIPRRYWWQRPRVRDYRYFQVQRSLQLDMFRMNRVGMASVVTTTSALTLMALAMTIPDEVLDTADYYDVFPPPETEPEDTVSAA